MFGEKTAIVLGAGASYCYDGGSCGIPIQQDIVGRLFFAADTGGGEGFPSFTGPSGPQHSFRLAKYLRERFGVPEDSQKKNAKMDYWTAIQEQGHNLESLYATLEDELTGQHRVLLDDFAAIVRTAVLNPVKERGVEAICPNHRRLCEALEPGDYIIDFNWDSVMADVLLYNSHFWFPVTGFGVSGINVFLPTCQKALPVPSLIQLFHLHGSVLLFELYDEKEPTKRALLYVGPRQWSAITGVLELQDLPLEGLKPGSHSIVARPELQPLEERILYHGHIFWQGNWFRPLFVPPSRSKPEYRHWFFQRLLRAMHTQLPATERFVIAGYSFPDADLAYLRSIFVPEVLRRTAVVEVINRSNDDPDFRRRVKDAFPGVEELQYPERDFRQFCTDLEIEFPDRPSLGRTGRVGGEDRRSEGKQAGGTPSEQAPISDGSYSGRTD